MRRASERPRAAGLKHDWLSYWLALTAACSSGQPAAEGTTPESMPGAAAPETPGAAPAAPPPVASGSSNEGLDPELPLAPPEGPAGAATPRSLSDACALAGEQNGWGPIERDLSNGEQEGADGGPISLSNTVYSRGLGMHAPAQMAFALGGSCSRFTATVGVDDEMKGAGSVRFEVYGDGVLLAQTDVLGGADAPVPLDVDVTGKGELRLVVDADGDSGSDHADWAEPTLTCAAAVELCPRAPAGPPSDPGYRLVWADEFDVEGAPNPDNWSFETGFVRNEEAQWYQAENASVRAGFLIIEGRRESLPNPNYRVGSADWKTNRQFTEFTSASLHSRGKQSFRFGRLEMRGRFPAYVGLWPAWWLLGNDGEWPSNGEVDILEYYQGALHANFVAGTTTRWEGNWDAIATPLGELGDADWDARFHVYRMDWTDTAIVLSVDGRELNRLDLAQLRNPDGRSPFLNPAYTLLNLAIGGPTGGDPSAVPFPVRYEVDYVRVFAAE